MHRIEHAPTRVEPMAAPSKCGSTQNVTANVRVIVRVRPLNDKEILSNNRTVVDVVDDQMLVFDPKEKISPFYYQGVQQPSKNYLRRGNKELKFAFDHVCGESASNSDVFEITTKDMLSALMEGYNCSVFAYGATGAGKTHTMIGNHEHPGITYLTMEHLFEILNSEEDREFEIAVSYIEVYNENVYDLLTSSGTPLQLREDSKYGVMVAGLTLHKINTARELLDMLENGNKNRTQHATDANAESSRSHAVFQVYVTMRFKTSCQFRIVKLSMIDLAGSERASATGCVGERFKEGANINKSLLSLGNCINKLADGSNFIPYRDSKLTRLLKDSLGGNCRTVMIANVSPSSISYEDTYNTLKYAARANTIKLSIKKNIVNGHMGPSQLKRINQELMKKIKALEALLSLSNVKSMPRIPDHTNDSAKELYRKRILEAEGNYGELESQLLELMSRQRVLWLRHTLRTRAFAHVADMAHRSSTEAVDLICTEEVPRQERAQEGYLKQSAQLDSTVTTTWNKWDDCRKKLYHLCEQAFTSHPDLVDFIEVIHLQSKLRRVTAMDNLKEKIVLIQHAEINAFTEYTIDMPRMLKKLYFTLKGYDKAPPALTAEYAEVMKKAKSKNISWSDMIDDGNAQFKFMMTLDTQKPSTALDFTTFKNDANATVDIITDSVDMTDIENRKPLRKSPRKRCGTPIKLGNNETIIINDSFENLNTTGNMNSAKKLKIEPNLAADIENYGVIDSTELNSTFVLAESNQAMKPIKSEAKETQPVKRGLADRTNILYQRPLAFGDKAKILKPIAVGKALPVRRAPAPSNGPRTFGFGSSTPRDNLQQRNVQVGYKAVRSRERVQVHPYSRPNARK